MHAHKNLKLCIYKSPPGGFDFFTFLCVLEGGGVKFVFTSQTKFSQSTQPQTY